MKKKVIPVLVVAVLILVIGCGYLILEHLPSKEQMNLQEYYGQAEDGQAVIVLGSEIIPDRAIIENGIVYLPLGIVQNTLNQAFYWDQEGQQILYASPSQLLKVPLSEETGSPVVGRNNNIYLSGDLVKEHTDADISVYENPSRVVIQYQWKDANLVTAKKNTYLRVLPDVTEKILTSVFSGEKLWYVGETEDWYEVSSAKGFIGYIRKKEASSPEVQSIERSFSENYSYITHEGLINMVWHQVTSELANDGLDDAVADVSGINVISPTWFTLTDNAGNVQSIATSTYVENAHARGWQVWGLVDNFTYEVDTDAILSSTSARQNAVNQLVQYALQYNLDGINVDFESLSEAVGPHFLQFLRELSVETHKNNLVLSVDNPVPEDFTSHYDRAEQGRVVDYVIIMGYDEHYVGSEAGSVASLPWVEKGIQDTLAEVPASRTINAMPFYCRVWKSVGQIVNTEAIGMADAQEVVNVHAVETYWDNTVGQNYGKYEDDEGNLCEIWIEDAQSIAAKTALVPKYGLAGVAAWKLGFETPDVWQTITENLS